MKKYHLWMDTKYRNSPSSLWLKGISAPLKVLLVLTTYFKYWFQTDCLGFFLSSCGGFWCINSQNTICCVDGAKIRLIEPTVKTNS